MPTTTPNPREGYRPNWVRMPPTYRGQSYSSRYGAQRAYNNSSRQTFNADRSREAAKTAYEQATNKSYEGVRTPASASAGAAGATAAAGAAGIPATATAGATGLPVVATVAAVVATVGTIVLDPFNKDPFLKLADENAILQNLMPPDPPQKIEEGKFPFTGGQAKVMYRVYRQRGWERNSSIYGDGTWSKYSDSVYYTDVMGPVRGTKIKVESDNLYHFYLLANNLSIDVAVLEVSSSIKNPWFEIINCQRLDGQPDTSGNPPPTVQPIYTTNITNNYTIVPPPIVGERTPPAPSAPPIIILPIGGSSSPSVASTPPPQIVIPELQPDIPILISPLPPSNQQTSPDTATSPPPPSYPSVTKSPSTGITAEEAEKSKYNNTQVTPSTGVKAESKTAVTPEVAPISESATRPTVKDSDRTLTFSSSAQSASSQSETLANSQTSVNKLLEIEQALTRLRVSISSLQPSDSATSLSNDIQRLERDTASLRERAPTISSETIATELQRIRNRLRSTQARIINLNPSAQSHLADLQRQQIEQQIDREITRLRSPSTTPGQQTETETQTPNQTNTETQTTLERLQEQLTNLGLGIALLTPLVNPIQNTANNTTPDALRNAAKDGVCQTTQPGGCMTNAIQKGNENQQTWIKNRGINAADLGIDAADLAVGQDTNLRVKNLEDKIGTNEYPMILPEYLLDGSQTPTAINNQAQFNAWSLKQWDALVGLFPIKIERTDENGVKQMLVYENVAEAIAEITGLLAQIAFDADTAVNVATRAVAEAIGAKIAALQAGSYVNAIIDHLGFQTQSTALTVPISVTPGAVGLDGKLQENELKDFLTPSVKQAIGIKNIDPVDLRLILRRILEDGEIARAALYRPLKPNAKDNSLTGDAIKADKTKEKKRINDAWEAFKTRYEGHTAGTEIDIDDSKPSTNK